MSLVTCITSPFTKAEPHITYNQAHGGINIDGANSDDINADDDLPMEGQDKEKKVRDG